MEQAYSLGNAGRGSLISTHSTHHHAVVAAGLLMCYLALDWATFMFPARYGITPFNPQAAVAIALLMFCGLRYLPLLYIVVFVGEYYLPHSARPVYVIVVSTLVLLFAYLAVAHLFSGKFRIRPELETRHDVLRLIAVTLIAMLLFGMIYVGILVYFGIGPLDRAHTGTRRFWIGYSVGILIAAPIILMYFSDRRRAQFREMLRTPVAYLQIVAIAASAWLVFGEAVENHIKYFYVLFLPLIWTAARFGMVGASFALALIQTGVLLGVNLAGYQPLSVFELQLLLIALAITGLLLGVTIDERQRADADFRESLKLAAAGEMAAAITHELNQPLTAMSSYATAAQLIAATDHPDRAQMTETMRKLVDESKRAAVVVRRLRDFFSTGATQLAPASIVDLAVKMKDSLYARAQAANVTIECRTANNIPTVLVDAVQIEVVLHNLLLNAIDAAASATQPGKVIIDIQVIDCGDVQVTVEDTGSGIRAADVDRLFKSFSTTKATGMGMGLAISRAIIDGHGGQIWAVPGPQGVLRFTLPIKEVQDG